MKNPFSAGSRHRPILAPLAGRSDLMQRTRSAIGHLPEPAAPAVAVVVIGIAVLAVSGTMLWLSGPSGDPSTGAPHAASNVTAAPTAPEMDTAARAVEASVAATPVAEPPQEGPGDRELRVAAAGDDTETAFDARFAADPVPSEPLSESETAPAPEMVGTVAVADTVEEVLELEAIQRREVEADLAEPSNEVTAAVPPPAPKVAAKATAWVNLRDGPSDDAEVLMVVPALADIEAQSGCNWCAVSYDGSDGYIYKNFISYE